MTACIALIETCAYMRRIGDDNEYGTAETSWKI
jgi:hypothetical protein